MTSKKKVERYPLERSPLYRMGRAKDLAALLRLTPKQLRSIIVRRSTLYQFKDEIISGKERSLAVPIRDMRAIHERLKGLLGRIVLPEYLYSPRRGRAAVDNARAHRGASVVVKLDIKQFYPSTTAEHVFQFFHHRLGMVDDVAGRLTKICTINGKVAFGSPLSPILCALVDDDLFGQVSKCCELNGDTMSLWVDDLSVSGRSVRKGLVRDITRLVASKRLKAHKAVRSTARRGIVITGTFIGRNGLAPANKSHLSMASKLRALELEADPLIRMRLAESLIGMVNHQMSIYPKDGEHYQRLKRRRQWLWDEFKRMRVLVESLEKVTVTAASSMPSIEASVPW